MPSQTKLATFELFGLFFGLSACILMKIHNTQPQPYMDEIFHFRQTVKYCEGKFTEWDPMITTLPGLYTSTVAVLNLVAATFDYDITELCDLFWMRCMNLMFCMGNSVLVYLLYNELHPVHEEESLEKWRSLFCTFTTAIFPPLYFFTFLYYTDAGSVFFVLLLYYTSLKGHHKSSALFGLISILFRQTNVIWVVFIAGGKVAEILLERIKPEKKDLTEEDLQSLKFVPTVVQCLLNDLSSLARLESLLRSVVYNCFTYICIGLAFLAFVIFNDGIVVGDRSAHQACLHFPQLFYFMSFSAGFTAMYQVTIPKLSNFIKSCLKHPFLLISLALVICSCVRFFTYEHAYLLADNRHYTFYIWSRIFKRHDMIRFALVPGYIFATFAVFDSLSHKNILWKMVFLICLLAATVPQKLLEFRYFLIPFLIFRLNMRMGSILQVVLEASLYVAVNSFTIYYFLEKSFTWPHAAGTQRFMW